MTTLQAAIHNTLYRAGEAISPSFSMPLTHSLTQGRGTLDSFIRAASTGATVTDFEGLVKDVTADEARFVGARRVENLVDWASLSSVPYGGSFYAESFDHANQIVQIDGTFTGGGDITEVVQAVLLMSSPYTAAPLGNLVRLSMEIRITPGWEKLTTLELAGGGYQAASSRTDITNQLTTEWVRISVPAQAVSILNGALIIDFFMTGSISDSIQFRKVQLEDVTGQINQNPSEYVSFGVGTSPELLSDPSLENELNQLPVNEAAWYWNNDTVGNIKFQKITGGFRGTVTGADSAYSDFIEYMDTQDQNKFNGEKICTEGRLYAITITIANSYDNVSAGNAIINVYAGYSDIATAIWNLGLGDGDGTFTVIKRAAATSPGGAQSSFWVEPLINGLAGDDFGFDITDISVKEIDHGSNVDGVKYFDTFNLNYVDSNIVKSHVGGQIISNDSEFAIADSSSGGTDGRWEWTGINTCVIEDGVLKHAANYDNLKAFYQDMADTEHPFNSLRRHLQGTVLKVEYRFNGDVDLTSSSAVAIGDLDTDIWGSAFPITPDTDLVAYGTGDSNVTDLVNVELGVDNTLEVPYFKVSIADSIPDTILKGVLIEEASSNRMKISTDDSTASFLLFGATRGSMLIAGGLKLQETIEDNSTGAHTVIPLSAAIPSSYVGSTAYTESVFVKQGVGSRHAHFVLSTNAYPASYAISLNLATGVVTVITAGMQSYGAEETVPGSGIWRLWITAITKVAPIAASPVLYLDNGTGTTYVGNGSDSLYIGGYQVEQLAFPSSFMPTTGATVNRGAEELTYVSPLSEAAISDITMYTEAQALNNLAAQYSVTIQSIASGDSITLFNNTTAVWQGLAFDGGNLGSINGVSTNALTKLCLRLANSELDMSQDGGALINDNTAPPVLDFSHVSSILEIGSYSVNYLNGTTKNVKVWDKALTDAQMQRLTS